MRLRRLPVVQITLGLAMIPAAFLFAVLGLLPILGDIITGRIGSGLRAHGHYTLAVAIASVAIIVALGLCAVSAILLLVKPTPFAVQLALAGAIFYWVYVLGHLAMFWIDSPHQTLWGVFTASMHSGDFLDYGAWDYFIAVAYTLTAFAYLRKPLMPEKSCRLNRSMQHH